MTLSSVAPDSVALSPEKLDQLLPMHLYLDADGKILRAGPTLVRVMGTELRGMSFFNLFRVLRPLGATQVAHLTLRAGECLQIVPQALGSAILRGQAIAVQSGGLILSLSFGIGVIEAVRQFDLTAADFATTDLAVEMLYLVEAKNAVLEEFRRLSLRLEGARSAAEEQALTDTLTGLRNRRALDLALASACHARLDFGLMHIDLDRFKQVNDQLGHAAGDHVLRNAAQCLRAETRSSDTVARAGGDEFVILLPGLTDADALMALAGRLVARLSSPAQLDGADCTIGASIGLTISTNYDRPDPATMLQDADVALYAAKNAGRGRVELAASPTGPVLGQNRIAIT